MLQPLRAGAASACALALASCYAMRSTSGGGEAKSGERRIDPADVAVPEGYRVECVAQGLTFPTGVCFDGEGRAHVVESGYCYGEVWTTPRLLRIEQGGAPAVIAEGGRNGPWNGVCFADGAFFVAEGGVLEGGRILRVEPDGTIAALIEDLPSRGDHHTNGPIARDGYVYFGQGTATNSGVVGPDNAAFGWLERAPDFCDVAGAELALRDATFESEDALHGGDAKVKTGAFAPFGEQREQVAGAVVCSGSIARIPIAGGEPERVAWGLRNPYGLAFASDGSLWATDNGYDERGSRPVWGAADHLWRIEQDTWYGWPDFSGGLPLIDDAFRPPGGEKLDFLIAEHPGTPPKPAAAFPVHASANGLDFARSETFGHVGQAFVALFGDEAPAVGKTLAPVGFKVVRVDVESGLVVDFATNRGGKNGPASLLETGGLERPVALRFDPSGDALYVVDFGVVRHDAEGAKPQASTGSLWRITREVAP